MSLPSPLNVLIVEDHELMARGIQELLETISMVHKVAIAKNAEEARSYLKSQHIDLAIMDIRLGSSPNGLDLTTELRRDFPHLKILMYSGDRNDQLMRQARDAGACGYVVKGEPIQTFRTAIDVIMAGRTYFPPLPQDIEPLTPTENEILRLLAKGLSVSKIAAERKITEATVRSHISSIKSKLGLDDRDDLGREARKRFPPDLDD